MEGRIRVLRLTLLAARAASFFVLAAAALHAGAAAQIAPIPPYDAEAPGASQSARAFLDSLDASARKSAVLAPDDSRRREWSNLPSSMVARPGVRLGDLSAAGRAALFRFLSSSLSPKGYRMVDDVLAAEVVLEGDRGARYSAGNYRLVFYGQPSAEGEWGWHFGGHHLAVNAAMNGDAVAGFSPTFVGTEPALFTLSGREYAPLREMHEAGMAVYNALSPERRSEARAFFLRPRDLETGAGEDGVIPSLEGSRVAEWPEAERKALLDAMMEWVGLMPSAVAARRMGELAAELDGTYFAWHGPADGSDDNYFRIQGPSLVIELLWRGELDDEEGAGHYHSVYRDPTNEYGAAGRRR